MKKILYIIGGFFALIILLLALLPIFFKGTIKEKVATAINESVNAQVYFEDFGLNAFRHFPYISASLEDFGVVGIDEFEGDTLVSVKQFKVLLGLKSLFSGRVYLKGIILDNPNIHVIVHENGKANYDIAKESTEPEAQTSSSSSEFEMVIDRWVIKNGNITYDDRAGKMKAEVEGLNHNGKGDFAQQVFDMKTTTTIDSLSYWQDGSALVSKKAIDMSINLNMDLPNSKYTFQENTIKINEFKFGFDGFIQLLQEAMQLDLTFAAKDNTFKSLLSLIPGAFMENYNGLEAAGNLSFDGNVSGLYDSTNLPAFQVNLMVQEGMFHFPDLPTSVTDVNLNLSVDNTDGVIDNTKIDISNFALKMGNNPLQARVLIENLGQMIVDADVEAKLDLAQVSQFYPVEGLTLKGNYAFDLQAQGKYDTLTREFPKINMNMSLSDGFIKSAEFPMPIENLTLASAIINETGKLPDTKVAVSKLNMLLDGQPFEATLNLENLDDYTWDVAINGGIDLEKITKVFPQEGMALKGMILANITSQGKMSALEAEKYDQLPTSGSMEITDFNYESADLAVPFSIESAKMNFDPKKIALSQFVGQLGESDMKIDGKLENYIAYIFKENEVLRGKMNYTATLFNANEWMSEEEEGAATATGEDSTAMEAVQIPTTIDFEFMANIDKVLYEDKKLDDVHGKIIMRDGILRMEKLAFATLGGQFAMTGTYDSRDKLEPKFDFGIDIKELSIPKSYAAFTTVQKFAPIAQAFTGKFSTSLRLKGAFDEHMNPKYESILGGGPIEILDATANKENKLVNGLVSNLSGGNLNKLGFKFITEIKNGRIFTDPFDVMLGESNMNLGGSQGVDGSLDYIIKADMDAGAVGQAINQGLAAIGGGDGNSSRVKINLNLLGTYDEPQFKLLSTGAGESTTGAAKSAIESKLNAEKENINTQVDAQKKELENKAKKELEEKQKEAERKAQEEADKIKREAEKKQKEAEEQAKKEAEKLKEEAKKKLKDWF